VLHSHKINLDKYDKVCYNGTLSYLARRLMNNNKTHGEAHCLLHRTWAGMKHRCKNPKYARYHGKGIVVQSEWLSYEGFRKWALENGYREGLSIDRIDPNGNYCAENCQWITVGANSSKDSRSLTPEQVTEIRILCASGVSQSAVARMYGVAPNTISLIIKRKTYKEVH
jgi:hypothetical protein